MKSSPKDCLAVLVHRDSCDRSWERRTVTYTFMESTFMERMWLTFPPTKRGQECIISLCCPVGFCRATVTAKLYWDLNRLAAVHGIARVGNADAIFIATTRCNYNLNLYNVAHRTQNIREGMRLRSYRRIRALVIWSTGSFVWKFVGKIQNFRWSLDTWLDRNIDIGLLNRRYCVGKIW